VFSDAVDETLKDICLEISKRYSIYFLEIGTDDNHVHFLVQSVPIYSPTKIVTIIKSITAREIFSKNPEVKKQFWEENSGQMDILSILLVSMEMKMLLQNMSENKV